MAVGHTYGTGTSQVLKLLQSDDSYKCDVISWEVSLSNLI